MPLWRWTWSLQHLRGKQMTTILIETLHHHAKSHPKRVAFHIGEDIWTYQRLADEVERLARGLVERGLRKGNRVALLISTGASPRSIARSSHRIHVSLSAAWSMIPGRKR